MSSINTAKAHVQVLKTAVTVSCTCKVSGFISRHVAAEIGHPLEYE